MKTTTTAFLIGAAILVAAPRAWSYDDVRFARAIKLEDVKEPAHVAVSSNRIYLLDERNGVLYIYDMMGKLLKSVGRYGSGPNMFSGPKDIAVAPPGVAAKTTDPAVYVADSENSRIQVLDAEGNFLMSFGSKGSGAGEMKYPQSVAVGADGRVYVSDTENNRVEVFTKDGLFLYTFGVRGPEQGHFRNPYRVEVDPADFVYVYDYGNSRIQKFSPKSKYVKEFNMIGTDFTIDPYGFLYMLDPKLSKVREMGPDGNILGALGRRPEKTGVGRGQFNEISDIRFSPDGALWILDRGEKNLVRVDIANKLKTEPLSAGTDPRILISGPVETWPISASVLSGGDGVVYACLSKTGQAAVIDRDGKYKLTFGKKGKDKESIRNCRGITGSEEHGFFISDAGGDKMMNYDSSGKFNAVFADATGFFDSKKKEGRVRSPQGEAITEKGTVYVADSGNRRVDAFSPDGTFLFSFGPQVGSFELQDPVSVAWDKDGFVFVLDRKLRKVFKCQPSGGLVASWGGLGSGLGEFQDPVALAYDGNDYLYVLDAGEHRVAVFNKEGIWMSNFLSYGEDDHRLTSPESLAVEGDRLLISDSSKNKILVFALHPRLSPPEGLSGSSVEGEVVLKWKAVSENWADGYEILRSTSQSGPYEAVGTAAKPEFKDGKVKTYQTYYYRVATVSKTKDTGAPSAQASVFIQGAFNRAPIEISSVEIGNIFSANYKFYKENPIGRIVLANNVNVPFENVKAAFLLKEFMDFGTDSVIQKIEPQQKIELPLKAVLNNKILSVTEDTPIQAEFTLTYFENGKPLTVSIDKPLRVYARNAITWDKPERIVTFITSNDTPIKDFRAQVLNLDGPEAAGSDTLNAPVVTAMKIWDALGAIGMKYQPAPNSPFEEVSKDPTFPEDYTQFPRETLKLKSGQCDDLATMISSMLESAGVKTALLDYPGHIALMFDTGSSDPADIGIPESQLISYQDTYWVPVEATIVGSPFAEAHRQAINAYRQMSKKGKAAIIDPRKAWATFEPATMPAVEATPDIPKAEELSKRLDADAASYVKDRYQFLQDYYKSRLSQNGKDTDVLNQLALLDVEIGSKEKAAEGFGRVLAVDADNPAALNNMGGLAFLKGDYPKADSYFMKAAEKDAEDPGIWLNLAKSAAKQKKADKVKEYGEKALALDPKNPDLQTAVQSLK